MGTAAALLTRNMQGPSLYTSFLPYLRNLRKYALTRNWHLQHSTTASGWVLVATK